MIQIIDYHKTHEFWIRLENGKHIKVFYDGKGRVSIKRPVKKMVSLSQEAKEQLQSTLKVIREVQGKPQFNFDGLWYTSKGYFVEVEGSQGWVLQEDGTRLQVVTITPDGDTKKSLSYNLNFEVGRLEIKKRPYDQVVKLRGMAVKKWPKTIVRPQDLRQ